jgi:hypothetical protein
MSKVKKDKRKSNVVTPKFGEGKGDKVAFNCDCCGEPITVNDLIPDHVIQAVESAVGRLKDVEVLSNEEDVLKVKLYGRRFDIKAFDPEEGSLCG